jgi:RND family efflux transporter MFP subunit
MVHKKLIKNILRLITIVLTPLIIQSCGGDEEAPKSLEQIHLEDGIPVQVEEVKPQPFRKYLSYFSKLSGMKEATKGAIVGGKIEKINFRVGDFVKEDQIVVQFPTDNMAVQYEQSKTAYETAEKNYNRVKVLLGAGETSQANYDAVETQYLVAKSNFESMRDMLFIDSPFDGYIVDIKVNEGDNVKSDTHLFTVAQLYSMKAKVWVTEKEIGLIKKGMPSTINIDDKTYTGKVTDVSLGIDPMKQAFYAEVEFPNKNMELKNGLTVEVNILVYEKKEAIIIPRNLVSHDEKGTFVFTVENNKAVKKYISNGNESGMNYEIKNGLKAGDMLVTKGSGQLDNGTKVKVIQ